MRFVNLFPAPSGKGVTGYDKGGTGCYRQGEGFAENNDTQDNSRDRLQVEKYNRARGPYRLYTLVVPEVGKAGRPEAHVQQAEPDRRFQGEKSAEGPVVKGKGCEQHRPEDGRLGKNGQGREALQGVLGGQGVYCPGENTSDEIEVASGRSLGEDQGKPPQITTAQKSLR